MFANAQMKPFQFHRPRTEVQPSPFDVVPGKPSVMSALRDVAAVDTSKGVVHRGRGKDLKPRVGRPMAVIDVTLLKQMIELGDTQQKCAEFFGVSKDIIRLRLGRKTNPASILRDNRVSTFNVAIASQSDSDRTNSIGWRA